MGREVGWCGRSKSGLVHTTNVLWGMTVEANRHRRSGKLVYRLVRQFTTSVGRSGRDEVRINQIFRDLWGIFHYCFHYYRGRGILRQFPKTTWIQKYHVCQSWILFLNFRSNCGRRNFFRRPMPETMFTSKEPPDAVGNIFGRKRGVFLDVAREIPRLKVMKPHNNIGLLTSYSTYINPRPQRKPHASSESASNAAQTSAHSASFHPSIKDSSYSYCINPSQCRSVSYYSQNSSSGRV